MINPTGKKLEKLLFGMLDDTIQGVDRYNHNGSLWLIFTNEMRWVVEYTKSQTLWYNYYFFKNEMEIIGLDCVDNKDLIQKWFESRFLNMGEVKVIDDYIGQDSNNVEDAIQNGVKDITFVWDNPKKQIKDTIQNGVKHTEKSLQIDGSCVIEDTIQNGVKGTTGTKYRNRHFVEETIQNGVKDTHYSSMISSPNVEDTIQNGVKDTQPNFVTADMVVEDAIQNGVKHTIAENPYAWRNVEGVIENGVKEVIELPELNPDLNGYGEYYSRNKNMKYPFNDIVEDVIKEK